eukprot:CAMPEP_0175051096 /NCGR_PEP_ID=MMETSP0052_2-20121109/7609_1 /TAXON_ID=51329 ORGANISM="Polytomella parva, Strain SAG 63-3" /NCGR_SAMPLE_ID=MMETSP0052_2 /ASSEMBLY_ACC=CAM_ASM_000194 /LENGTH=428 /DNA_ID=CAMNT_0016315341 /DNA_START=145 /DNA_END=1427 /DNA_ORIENTATION=+
MKKEERKRKKGEKRNKETKEDESVGKDHGSEINRKTTQKETKETAEEKSETQKKKEKQMFKENQPFASLSSSSSSSPPPFAPHNSTISTSITVWDATSSKKNQNPNNTSMNDNEKTDNHSSSDPHFQNASSLKNTSSLQNMPDDSASVSYPLLVGLSSGSGFGSGSGSGYYYGPTDGNEDEAAQEEEWRQLAATIQEKERKLRRRSTNDSLVSTPSSSSGGNAKIKKGEEEKKKSDYKSGENSSETINNDDDDNNNNSNHNKLDHANGPMKHLSTPDHHDHDKNATISNAVLTNENFIAATSNDFAALPMVSSSFVDSGNSFSVNWDEDLFGGVKSMASGLISRGNSVARFAEFLLRVHSFNFLSRDNVKGVEGSRGETKADEQEEKEASKQKVVCSNPASIAADHGSSNIYSFNDPSSSSSSSSSPS